MTLPCGVESEFDRSFRVLLSKVMSECGLRREEIAERLTPKVGRDITLSQLNDYTTTTRMTARFPAAYVPAFCEVTGDDRLRQFLLNRRSRHLLELGKQTLDAERAKSELIKKIVDAGKEGS